MPYENNKTNLKVLIYSKNTNQEQRIEHIYVKKNLIQSGWDCVW